MIARLVLVVAATAACDRLYSAPSHHPADGAGDDAPPCAPMTMLAGDFGAGTQSFQTGWWHGETTGPAQFRSSSSSSLTISIPSTTVGGTARVTSNAYLDLRTSSFTLAIITPAALPPDAHLTLSLIDSAGSDSAQIVVAGTMIQFLVTTKGSPTTLADATFNPVTDHYWRIANAGTMTMWQTSQDGTTFKTRAMTTGLPWIGYLQPQIAVDRPSSALAVEITIDHINNDASSGDACPISQLADDFHTTVLADRWYTRVVPTNIGTVTANSGDLLLSLPGGAVPGKVELVSSTVYDLRDGAVAINIVGPVAAGTTFTRFGVFAIGGDIAQFEQDATSYSELHHETVFSKIDATTPAWWRVREAGGMTYWETGPDGTTWPSSVGMPGVLGLDRVQVVVGMVQVGGSPTATARFDNVNTP